MLIHTIEGFETAARLRPTITRMVRAHHAANHIRVTALYAEILAATAVKTVHNGVDVDDE